MPWNPSTGQFYRINPNFQGSAVWDEDRQANIKIIATRHDFHDNDIAAGISQCLNTNGYNQMLANLDMGGFTLTNVVAGTDVGDVGLWDDDVASASFDDLSRELTLTLKDGDALTPVVIPVGTTTATEAAWTPAITNATMGGGNAGWYHRNGRMVTLFGYVEWIARVSSNNSILITGLPYAIAEAQPGMGRSVYVTNYFPGAGMAVSGIASGNLPEASINGLVRYDSDPAWKTLVLATYFGTNNPDAPGTVKIDQMKTLSAAGRFGFTLQYLTDDPV